MNRGRKSSPNRGKTPACGAGTQALSHVNAEGRARMVDVSGKAVTSRLAEAFASVLMEAETLKKIKENLLAKGDVLGTAKIAGILAAKKTHELIPLCHPLKITEVDLSFSLEDAPPRVDIRSRVRAQDRTGVEMEALTAATVAALTVYDMCKAVDRAMRITDIVLTKKTGGKSGTYVRKEPRLKEE